MSRHFAKDFIDSFNKVSFDEQVKILNEYGLEVNQEDISKNENEIHFVHVGAEKPIVPVMKVNLCDKKNSMVHNLSFDRFTTYKNKANRGMVRARTHKQG